MEEKPKRKARRLQSKVARQKEICGGKLAAVTQPVS
jgi:hypothetical protein